MSSFPPKPVPKTPPSSPNTSPPAPAKRELKPKGDRAELRAPSPPPPGERRPPGSRARSEGDDDGDSMDLDDGDEMNDDGMLATSRRVKVYELIASHWHDRGTGLCNAVYDVENDSAMLLARAEDNGAELLRSTIHVDDVYQKQSDPMHHETLIVWTEPDGTDFALSFQDQEGCSDVWDFICEVQTHLQSTSAEPSPAFSPPTQGPPSPPSSPSVTSSPDRLGASGLTPAQRIVHEIIQSSKLPTPAFGNIPDIDLAIKIIARNNTGKQKLCEFILTQDYWKALMEVHEQAEDLESLEDLHALCILAQTILLLNDPGIYDYIIQDDIFLGVMGMLEYDPEFPSLKANYREFLSTVSQYKEVVNFKSDVVLRKIHNTYRLLYLKDVVLARVLDDPMFNVLNSCILFHQVDIIHHISSDEAFLRELFGMFDADSSETKDSSPSKSPASALPSASDSVGSSQALPSSPAKACAPSSSSSDTIAPEVDPDARRRDVILLIHQLCMMGKQVQLPARLALYRKLVDRGLLRAIEWALCSNYPQMLNAAGEVLTVVTDHDSQGVRAFILRQSQPGSPPDDKKRHTLLHTLQRLLASGGGDLALKSQMADSIRMLVELPSHDGPLPAEAVQRAREDPIMEKYLQYFYDSCVKEFFKPIFDLPEFKLVSRHPPVLPPAPVLSKSQTSHILYLCDLLGAFVVQHAFRSSYFVLTSNITTHLGSLLLAREKQIRISALRFFRALLKVNNQFIHRHMIKCEMFYAIIELAGREAKKDSLIGACCQEYFEYLRKDNIRLVIRHMMDDHGDRMRELGAAHNPMGRMINLLILRWEQNNEMQVETEPEAQPTAPAAATARKWGQGRLLESEEEDYFNTSDDEDEGASPKSVSALGKELAPPPGRTLKRKAATIGGPKAPQRTQPRPLVDYDEGDGDEDMDAWKPDLGEGSSKGVLGPSPRLNSPPREGSPPAKRRTILRPRPIYTNGLKPSSSVEPSSPTMDVPGGGQSPILMASPTEVSPRNGERTPSPPPSKLRRSPPPSPRARAFDPSPSSPPRLSDKRKRDDDDDDDLLGSLSRGGKRRASMDDAEPSVPLAKPVPLPAAKEEAGKKIKLNLTKSAIVTASSIPSIPPAPPPTSSSPPSKDNG